MEFGLEATKTVLAFVERSKAEYEHKGLIPTLDLLIDDLKEYIAEHD